MAAHEQAVERRATEVRGGGLRLCSSSKMKASYLPLELLQWLHGIIYMQTLHFCPVDEVVLMFRAEGHMMLLIAHFRSGKGSQRDRRDPYSPFSQFSPGRNSNIMCPSALNIRTTSSTGQK